MFWPSLTDLTLQRLCTKFGECAFLHAGPSASNALLEDWHTVADPASSKTAFSMQWLPISNFYVFMDCYNARMFILTQVHWKSTDDDDDNEENAFHVAIFQLVQQCTATSQLFLLHGIGNDDITEMVVMFCQQWPLSVTLNLLQSCKTSRKN